MLRSLNRSLLGIHRLHCTKHVVKYRRNFASMPDKLVAIVGITGMYLLIRILVLLHLRVVDAIRSWPVSQCY